MNKKIIIVVGVFALLALLSVLLVPRNQTTYYASQSVARNIQQPFVSGNQVYFFSGHGFAKYDLASQKTATLTDFTSLPEVSNIKWSETGAIFQTNAAYPNDDLFYYLTSGGFIIDHSYWWLADFKTGQISLIGEKEKIATTVKNVAWSDNGRYIVQTQHGEGVPVADFYQSSDVNLQKAYTLTKEDTDKILWASGSKVIFSSYGQDRGFKVQELDLVQRKVTTLPDFIEGNITVSRDGNFFAFHSTSGDSENEPVEHGDLYLFERGTAKPQAISEGFSGIVRASATTNGFFISKAATEEQGSYLLIDAVGEQKKIEIKDAEEGANLQLIDTFEVNFEQLIAVDGANSLRVLAGKKQSYPEPPSIATNIDTNQRQFSVTFIESSGLIAITIKQSPYKGSLKLALDYLRQRDVDTNQVSIVANEARGIPRTE